MPALILGYQRLDRIIEIGATLAASQPCCVYVSIDGPSFERSQQLQAFFREFRSLFTSSTKIYCSARKKNLGIALHLKVAGDEVIATHESFVILEDDCIPSMGFFTFMEIALKHHKEDSKVGMVTANTLVQDPTRQYTEISDFPMTWGWGTFKRVWEKFDPQLSNLSESEISAGVRRVHKSPFARAHWMERIHRSIPDRQMWDAQWTAFLWATGLRTINPSVELVSNKGMDENAIHTKANSLLLSADLKPTSNLPWQVEMVDNPRPWNFARRTRHFLVFRLESLQMLLQKLGFLGPYKLFRRLLSK